MLNYFNHYQKRQTADDDGVLANMLEGDGNCLTEKLVKLFNISLEKQYIPSDWTNAVVVLIYKKENLSEPENIGLSVCCYQYISWSPELF